MKGKQKKDLSKVKCFNYDEMGHFSLRCLMKKKGDEEKRKGKQAIGVAILAEINDLTKRLVEECFSMISHFSQGTLKEDGSSVDSGVAKDMTGSQDVFENLSK